MAHGMEQSCRRIEAGGQAVGRWPCRVRRCDCLAPGRQKLRWQPPGAAVAEDDKRIKDEAAVREKAVDAEEKRVAAEEEARIKVGTPRRGRARTPPRAAVPAIARLPSVSARTERAAWKCASELWRVVRG